MVFLLLFELIAGKLMEGASALELLAEKMNGGAVALSVELPVEPPAGGRFGPGSVRGGGCPVAA